VSTPQSHNFNKYFNPCIRTAQILALSNSNATLPCRGTIHTNRSIFQGFLRAENRPACAARKSKVPNGLAALLALAALIIENLVQN
jgi:hypothetical protein